MSGGNALRFEVAGSRPGVTYTVEVSDRDDTIYCSCPAWKFQRGKPAAARKFCKHIVKVLRDNGLEP